MIQEKCLMNDDVLREFRLNSKKAQPANRLH